ncbi:MAG: ABC transporter ATP-binding protein [Pseudomonadota bacterium]
MSAAMQADHIFQLLDVEKVYRIDRGGWNRLRREPPRRLAALDGVRLTVQPGDSIALVGESGSGKSTLLRVLLGLTPASDGRALYRGEEIDALAGDRRRTFQRDVAMVYQDARASLNPRLKALDLIAEPLRQHALCPPGEIRDRVIALLTRVGMPADTVDRYPSQLSGGQVRRVAIARALASEPKVIVADEAVSGLDVSTQAQLLNLLRGLQREMGLTLLFITHDLAVASYLCRRIAVMYLGRIVETGPTKDVLRRPLHPYTRALLNASPRFFAPIAETLAGEIPSPIDLPPGCRFASRCPRAAADCRAQEPPLASQSTGREAACLHPLAD